MVPVVANGDAENLQLLAEEDVSLDPEALKQQSEEAPIIRLVNFILVDSLRSGASDVHIEPFERELRIRFRIDGVLKTVMNPPVKLKDAMTSRIKIMARMNISEKRVLRMAAFEFEPNWMERRRKSTFAFLFCRHYSAKRLCCGYSTRET